MNNNAHDYWLAMQAAHEKYRGASETLEYAQKAAEGSSPGERSWFPLLEREQRTGFEDYVEARMAFLEFWLDESKWPQASPVDLKRDAESLRPDANRALPGSWFANRWPVLQVLGALLVCTAAFSLFHDQKHARELASARAELQLLGRRLDFPALPRLPQNTVDTNSPIGAQKSSAAERQSKPRIAPPALKPRRQRHFSLVPSRRFKRVGPIEVSVRSVDVQRNGVSLAIMSDRVKMNVDRLHQNQTVWIKAGDRQRPVGLVIDRIAKDRLDGHLIVAQAEKPEPMASGVKSKLSAMPWSRSNN